MRRKTEAAKPCISVGMPVAAGTGEGRVTWGLLATRAGRHDTVLLQQEMPGGMTKVVCRMQD